MKISIDTSQDSHEDIKKAIKLLTALIEGRVYSNAPDLRNVFDNPIEPTASQDSSTPDPSPAPTNVLGMFDNPETIKKPEEKKDVPDVEFY